MGWGHIRAREKSHWAWPRLDEQPLDRRGSAAAAGMSAAAFPAHSVSTVWPLVSSDWWLSLSLARGWPVAVTISCVLLMTVAYAVAMCVLREPERRVGRKSKKALKRSLPVSLSPPAGAADARAARGVHGGCAKAQGFELRGTRGKVRCSRHGCSDACVSCRVLRRYNTGEERLLEETEESIPDWSTVERQLQNEVYRFPFPVRSSRSAWVKWRVCAQGAAAGGSLCDDMVHAQRSDVYPPPYHALPLGRVASSKSSRLASG